MPGTKSNTSSSSSSKKSSTKRKTSSKKDEVEELSEVNHNEDITKMLKVILDYFTRQKDWMRVRAYKSAIESLSSYKKRVESGKEAQKLTGIGPGIAKKIDEYIQTGKCKLYEEIMQDPATAAMMELQRVHGIGAAKASELAESGVTSLDELQKPEYQASLTEQQKIALKYVRELEQPIPKEEADEIYREVEKAAKPLGIELKLVGALRRGRPNADSIDIVMRHKDYTEENPDKVAQHAKTKSCPGPDILKQLVQALKKNELIEDDLTELQDKGLLNYRGIVLAPSQKKKGTGVQKSSKGEETSERSRDEVKNSDQHTSPQKDPGVDIDMSGSDDEMVVSHGESKKKTSSTGEAAPAAPIFSVPSLEEVEESEDAGGSSVPSMWNRGKEQPSAERVKRKAESGPSIEVMDEQEMETKKRRIQEKAESHKSQPLTGPIHRMLVLKLVPYNFWWTAVLSHTGPDIFLSSVRTSAKKKGYNFNTYALRKELGQWTQKEIDDAIEEGTMKKRGAPRAGDPKLGEPEALDSEEDVFEKIGMAYRPPEKRG